MRRRFGVAGQSYRDLIAWQRAMDLVASIYAASRGWPESERFGLVNQVRRAVVSVPSNIAEGQRRGSAGDFARFVAMARGSLAETETQLMIARRLGYQDEATIATLLHEADEVGRLVGGLLRSLR
jgi:four helix bundle protein